jgi:hypothetical protein
MEDQINRENYEAFYLDYLEGNQDKSVTLELFAFLANNPELRVEDLGPKLSNSSLVLDVDFKNNLKQDISLLSISTANIEYALTAEKENQLSKSKLDELHAFVVVHPAYKLDRKIYSLSTLTADKSIIYTDKKALKQRDNIVPWPFLSLFVAACAIFVIWLIPNSAYNGDVDSVAHVPAIKVKIKKPNGVKSGPDNIEIVKDTIQNVLAQNIIIASKKTIPNFSKLITGNLALKKIQKFDPYHAENVDFSTTLQEKMPDAIAYRSIDIPLVALSTLAMKNPVKPLTNKISDIIKTQVDYQTGEDAISQRKGFYLKIGQLEISQNKKLKSQR